MLYINVRPLLQREICLLGIRKGINPMNQCDSSRFAADDRRNEKHCENRVDECLIFFHTKDVCITNVKDL